MHVLCHKGQWISTKCLCYCSSLIKSTCTHRCCQFIHTVSRVTSPKTLEISGYGRDLPPHTVRKLLLLYSSLAYVGYKGLIQLKLLNLILIQVYLKECGRRKIPEVWPHPLVSSTNRGRDRWGHSRRTVADYQTSARVSSKLSWCTAGHAGNLSEEKCITVYKTLLNVK